MFICYTWTAYSYQILNPKGIKGIEDPKKCTKILIESTELNDDQYRLGNTKARNIFLFQSHNNKSWITQLQQKHFVYGFQNRCPEFYTYTHTHTYTTHTHATHSIFNQKN